MGGQAMTKMMGIAEVMVKQHMSKSVSLLQLPSEAKANA